MGKREWKGGRDGVERRKTELPIRLEKMKMICQQQNLKAQITISSSHGIKEHKISLKGHPWHNQDKRYSFIIKFIPSNRV